MNENKKEKTQDWDLYEIKNSFSMNKVGATFVMS